MSDFTVKIHNRAAFQLRRDPAVIAELERRGRQIVNAANRTLDENRLGNKVRSGRFRSVGYKMSSFQGRKVRQGRWFVQIYAASNHAKFSNARHNTLIRVLNDTQSVNAVDLRAGDHP